MKNKLNSRQSYDNEKERQGFIGKERDLESGLADHGVRKYDYISGRFTSTDPLWEKYMGLTPYQYSANNPIGLLDDNGKDIKQRQGAMDFAKSYLNSGSTYLLGAKYLPGKPVDCSGLVNNSIMYGGDEPSLIGRGVSGTGVQQIEKVTQKIEDLKNIEQGNIVTFRTGGWGYHTGIIIDIERNEAGEVVSFSYIHSSSKRNGAGIDKKSINDKSIYGFFKWDTKPDSPYGDGHPKSIIDMQKQIDPNVDK